jgi:hypothetical protein
MRKCTHNGHWQMLWNNKKKGIKFNFFWDACLLKGLGTSSTAAGTWSIKMHAELELKLQKGWDSTGGKWDRCKLRTIFMCSFSRNSSNNFVCVWMQQLYPFVISANYCIACCHRDLRSSRLLCKHTHSLEISIVSCRKKKLNKRV